MDIATPDAVTFQKRIQASRDSDLREFGIDIFRDLARVAGGTPIKSDFAKFVAGKDSLSITCKMKSEDINKKCQEVFDVYLLNDYQNDFSWIDNLQKVQEKALLDSLNSELMQAVGRKQKGEHADLHMSPPEIVNYTEGSLVHYNGFGSHGTDFHRLSIEDYISEMNRCGFTGTIEDIKQHKIKAAKVGSEKLTEKWNVYDCFVFETEISEDKKPDRKFVLFSGDWYEVDSGFKNEVDTYFNNIESCEIIKETSAENEQALIKELTLRTDLVKLDQEFINPAGVRYANLESCDFFSDKKEFIHLKDAGSSKPISHLWMQGVVSAEAFVSDSKFRGDLRKRVQKIKKGFEIHLPKANQPPVRADYKIIYGIMREPYKDGSISIPFFSKVSLRAAVERLEQLGFRVALNLIKKEK